MKLKNIIFTLFLLLTFPAKSDEVESFINKLDNEYSILLKSVPDSEQIDWNKRKNEIAEKVSKEIRSNQEIVNYFKKEGTYDKYKNTLS